MSDVNVVPGTNPMLNDKWYGILEWWARVGLPASATLYGSLGALWAFPNVTPVVGTIVAVDTFLGIFLGFAQRSYDSSDAKYDGTIEVINQAQGTLYSLNLNAHPDTISDANALTFKVNPTDTL